MQQLISGVPLIPIVAAAILALGACNGSSSQSAGQPPVLTERDKIANYQVMAQNTVKASLRDPDSVKYEDVHAYRVVVDGKVIGYAFCGQMNAKNGFGG